MKNKGEIIIYETPDHQTQVEVKFEEDTVWLTQKQIAILFDKNRVTVTEHIRNVFKEKELEENSVCSEYEHTAIDAKKYNVKYYKPYE